MKKIIFLLLLAQTISFITADSGCQKYAWGWGERAPEHTECHCNCEQYVQVLTNRRACNECGHYRIPKQVVFASQQMQSPTSPCNQQHVERKITA